MALPVERDSRAFSPALALLARAGALLAHQLRPNGHHPGCGNPYPDGGVCTDRCRETRAVLREAQALLSHPVVRLGED